jgi:hypothetical protein
LLPTPAQAQCTNWDASGPLTIIQRGTTDNVELTLAQNGRVITGTAGYHAKNDTHAGFGRRQVMGTVDGTIDGDSFSVQIFWPDNLTGVYNGKILPSGRLDGETYDKNNAKIRQTWRSEGVLKCTPPPVKPKPIRSSGKARITPTTPPRSAQAPVRTSEVAPSPPLKPPFIVAGNVVFPAPYVPTGLVVLQWDGGPDHPYAEVWVKVNDGDQTFVVERGKGGLQVPVQRGMRYLYILTDAGQTLSTVRIVP